MNDFKKQNINQPILKNQSGQILIEYVLLLLIGLMVGNIIVKQLTMMSSDPEEQGVIIRRWNKIWDSIGKDYPDKID